MPNHKIYQKNNKICKNLHARKDTAGFILLNLHIVL